MATNLCVQIIQFEKKLYCARWMTSNATVQYVLQKLNVGLSASRSISWRVHLILAYYWIFNIFNICDCYTCGRGLCDNEFWCMPRDASSGDQSCSLIVFASHDTALSQHRELFLTWSRVTVRTAVQCTGCDCWATRWLFNTSQTSWRRRVSRTKNKTRDQWRAFTAPRVWNRK